MPEEVEPVVDETPAAPELTGPWANDVREFFENPATQARVNEFMATKYQPYVTKLEQESAPARDLYKDLTTDFDGTMAALLSEVYDDRPDIAERYQQLVAAGVAPEAAAAQADEEVKQELPPEVQEIVAERQEAKQREAYETAVGELKAKVNDPEFDDAEFAPFVITANGNLDHAYQGYTAWRDAVKARYAPAEVPVDEPVVPAPLGTTTTGEGSPTPPVAKKYTSMADALDDYMDEQRAARQAPTTVGTV